MPKSKSLEKLESASFFENVMAQIKLNLKQFDMFKVNVNILVSRKESPSEFKQSKKINGSAADGRK